MGLFDDLVCKYPLPTGEGTSEVSDETFQTKSLACFLDRYEIREDGTLWHEEYDIEDQSDPDAKGLEKLFGMITKVNYRWVPVPLTGEVLFYRDTKEFSAYFVNGVLKELHKLNNRGEYRSALSGW